MNVALTVNKINLLKEKTLNNEVVDLSIRIQKLKLLKKNIQKYEQEILNALQKDLGKPLFEAYSSEILFTLKEIDYAIRNVKEFLIPKKVSSPIYVFRSKSFIRYEPYGLVFIISPWNYPFQLVFAPLISSYAVGNRVVVKPSNKSKETNLVIKKIINETFNEEEVLHLDIESKKVIPDVIEKVKFDKIFFTGSTNVGIKISEAAAKTLTPVLLELGGKSPCIIDKDVNLKVSIKRIISSKFFNAGQTCIAPDYLLVHDSIKNDVVKEIRKTIQEFYGENPLESKDYGKIINKQSFTRLKKHLEENQIIIGGKHNEEQLKIEPTILEGNINSEIMNEEIFGPLLPIITFREYKEAVKIIRKNPEPLALYIFSKNKKVQELFLKEKFGGGCVNNAMMHISNLKMPFGGIGRSGTGRYHGEYSFKAFTYEKSILKTNNYPDIKLRYPPYKEKTLKYLKRI
jgi:aldehyde dehydrogenase (NAD+)